MIAIDTNILVYLWLPSDKTPVAEKIYYKDSNWIAPAVWRSEFRNVVSLYIRRGVSFADGLESINRAENLMKENEIQVNSEEVMKLVQLSGCSAYDCEFVHVAQIRSVPLITFDQQVLRKFPDIAIDPLKFIEKLS
ncbi:MAG: type II toxin-antitoxin system VapC family toxin [Cyclobacteriaceae bacterium]